jgi:hypothetical protein
MLTAEAVLCEDGKHVMFYVYDGDDLAGTHTQPLPIVLSQKAFETCRSEWERSFRIGDWGIPPAP